jgi:hypothetical protein
LDDAPWGGKIARPVNRDVIFSISEMQAEVQEEFQSVASEVPRQTKYASVLQSKRWKELRLLVIKRAGGVCVRAV